MAGEQTSSNVIVAVRREATPGTPPGTGSGVRVRITDSQGLALVKALARSAEKRADGNRQKGRHSSRSVSGGYNNELTAGGANDIFLEALLRAAATASATRTQAELTSIAIASNVITAGGGSFITQGFRFGQIIYLTGCSAAANDNRNCMVTAVTASTMAVLPVNGVALTDMGADTTFSIVRRGHIINGAAPTRFHHTIEQYDVDHERSEQFTGCKVVGLSLNIVPGQPVTCAWNIMGFNRTLLDTGSAPYYVTPSLTTGLAMVGDEIALRYNGALATRFTSLKLDFNLAAAGVGVLGSLTTPDIFDNDLSIDATATVIRASHSDLTLYEAETAFEMSLVLENRVSVAPFECYGFSFPVVTIDDQKAPVGGGDGPKVDTLQLGFGTKVAATGYDGTKFIVSSSAIA